MTAPASPRISRRKQPQQARSASVVTAILEAAIQVLAEVGARRFTTARVAERAGVSVGSLYQYFPNKAAILFQLQTDEWRDTTALLRRLLEDRTRAPQERLRATVHAFVRSECEEAAMRVALGDAAPLYRDAPEAEEPRAAGTRAIQAFLREAVPDLTEPACRIAGDLIAMTLSAVGEAISERALRDDQIAAYADGMADMLSAYLSGLAQPRSAPAIRP
ncbi:TetR family transcriptional regulator [Methylobacterium sp. J-030]|uniref:TetR family transcriptional regulator n=1 Tax=Methylobacterium sp. J-030 TaxID=2836627 RepID=UPI001FBC0DE4|nr:TetR family transcriptional regulator [Methylobacterium sp. J-030]MCJ2074006.1 TetR family transcriptional regulator [Methylobacterium sp. J-030]